MKLINCNINALLKSVEQKKLICYGSDPYLWNLCERFTSFDLWGRFNFIISNESTGSLELNGVKKPLVKPEWFLSNFTHIGEFALLFINVKGFYNFLTMKYQLPQEVEFFIGDFLEYNPPSYCLPEDNPEASKLKIPKILHYCWFGENPMPPLYQKYIESWKKFCPDYEIREWNENNYDVTQNTYMYDAYRNKKWAFVADYVRMDVIYRYGGVYLDVDVELLKPIDRFLNDTGFCGVEAPGYPSLGLVFGAIAGHELILMLRDMYDSISFINNDGTLNMTPNTIYQVKLFRNLGLTSENKIQRVYDMTVYPTDVFCPMHPNLVIECLTEKSHAVHHFGWSWGNEKAVRDKLAKVKGIQNMLSFFTDNNFYHFPPQSNKVPATVVIEPNYYNNKQQFIDDNFEVTQYVSLDIKLAGSLFKGKTVVSALSLIDNVPEKVVVAAPFSDSVNALIRFLLEIGVNKDNIIFTFNEPNFTYDELVSVVPNDIKYSLAKNGSIICEIEDKKLLASSYNEMFIAKEVFYNKCYDFSTPHKSVTVIDIGMNIGSASIFYSTKEGVNRVYAFEPFITTFERALENFKLNELQEDKYSPLSVNVLPHSYGVSNANKALELDYDKNLKGLMSTTFKNEQTSNSEKVTVELTDIAEIFTAIIEKHPEDQFVFKLDCEGAEYDIFNRLDETGLIKKVHIFTLEWHNHNDCNVTQLESILNRNGFIYQVIGARNRPTGMMFATNGL